MSKKTIKIATRKSPLALWQAYFVRDELLARHDDLDVELVKMVSKGDKILDVPLAKVGGKGLFVKELEEAGYMPLLKMQILEDKVLTKILNYKFKG